MYKFYKYESLGNDFILLDYSDFETNLDDISKKPKNWSIQVCKLCDRNYGIGADGVLLLKKNPEEIVEVMLYNSDGSKAEKCLNGLRCASLYLFSNKNYSRIFTLKMSGQQIGVEILGNNSIKLNAGRANYHGVGEIVVDNKKISGHIVDLGNPHFIVLAYVNLEWLEKWGGAIECNPMFPNKSNVEFVWYNKQNNTYQMLAHERGCGITKACGSGAAAAIYTLLYLNKIVLNQKISIQMLGGNLVSYITEIQNIIQEASASFVFCGEIVLPEFDCDGMSSFHSHKEC